MVEKGSSGEKGMLTFKYVEDNEQDLRRGKCYEPACGQGRGLDAALRGDKKGRKAGRAALPMGGWVT